MPRCLFPVLGLAVAIVALAGCDALGIESAETVNARKQAEAHAIGAACRHAGRALEDCYTLNPKADKAAIFTGWREMNDYMRENEIAEVVPQLPHPRQSRLQPPTREGEEREDTVSVLKPRTGMPG